MGNKKSPVHSPVTSNNTSGQYLSPIKESTSTNTAKVCVWSVCMCECVCTTVQVALCSVCSATVLCVILLADIATPSTVPTVVQDWTTIINLTDA